ncbi:MAG: hypothetical protein PHU85_19055 [Phycisphaerae bacterium]|nr:hypothetical protein [Phycisphaerae bacterium]
MVFTPSRETMTAADIARVSRMGRRFHMPACADGSVLDGRRGNAENSLEVCSVSVEECYILPRFDEERPLYLLDVGGLILILFGQWLYDPTIVDVPEQVLDRWQCSANFFRKFTIRWSEVMGVVFHLTVEDDSFIAAQPLAVEFNKLREC